MQIEVNQKEEQEPKEEKLEKIKLFDPLEVVERAGFEIGSAGADGWVRVNDFVAPLYPRPVALTPCPVKSHGPLELKERLGLVGKSLFANPVGWAYDTKGAVIGLKTEAGIVVPCLRQKIPLDLYDFYLSNLENRVKAGKGWVDQIKKSQDELFVFTPYNSPFRIANRFVLPSEEEPKLLKRLVDEVAANHHTRCRLFGWTSMVGSLAVDVFPGETLSELPRKNMNPKKSSISS
jgi:hypothetical protein